MTRKLNFYLLTTLFFILTSCSKDNDTQSLIEYKLERMSGKEMLVDLLIRNNNNINQLARIFDCSPSSLKRILNGNTRTTPKADEQFKKVLRQVLITNDKCFKDLDPYYNSDWKMLTEEHWGKAFLCLLLSITIISVLLIIESKKFLIFQYVIGAIMGLIILSVVVLYIGWLSIRIYMFFKGLGSEPIIIDNYENLIDTIWETF